MVKKLQRVRSWYGLSGEISVENRLWHLVKVGPVPLPHPPLVNLVLRKGLPHEERLRLSFLHEFGHLQTFPLAFLLAGLLLVSGHRRHRGLRALLKHIVAGAIAHEAVWELSSEAYAIAMAGLEYRRIYRRYPNRLGRFFFWGGRATLATFASLWFRHSGKPNSGSLAPPSVV